MKMVVGPAGKETLIKSVATAIPSYPMSCFKFPISLCNEINSILANFWWGNSDSNGVHWKSWNFLCNSKTDGGLGFRNLVNFNDSLLAKQAWRLSQHPLSLCARVLTQRYFPHSLFASAKRGASPSWIWSSILVGKKLLDTGALWSVGNGESISIWNDNWIPLLPPKPIHPSPSLQKVSSLINWSNNSWQLDPIIEHISDSQRDLNSVHPSY